jgi:hypothetical protein
MDMRKRALLIIIGLVALLAVFIFAVPLESATQPGNICTPQYAPCLIHYQKSLSCDLFNFGDMYWQGQMYLVCAPPF